MSAAKEEEEKRRGKKTKCRNADCHDDAVVLPPLFQNPL